ncbi:MAG: YfiR family protein, partial [Zetaproteobacteria bacterium]|nr:YfiR family protein [Zetaproteobacteria bacterium]
LEDALDCHLVFIGEHDELAETLWTLRKQPVLTVSNATGFAEKGGIIQFKLIKNKIRFLINTDAAKTAGLTISSKLLSLAISVTGTR